MRNQGRWYLPVAGLALALVTCFVGRDDVSADGAYGISQMPDFKLKDPLDKEHASSSLTTKATVVIITIPNVKHGEFQKRWSKWLMKKDWPAEANLVMVEDLSQAETFKEKAISGMKKSFKAEKPPLLLLDHTGDVRKLFRITNDETAVLVFDKTGKTIHKSEGDPTIEEAQKIVKLVDKIK